MLKWPEKMGEGAIRLSAVLAILLMLVQAAMTDEDVRSRLSIGEQFEGKHPGVAVSTLEPVAASSVETSAEKGAFVSPWAVLRIRVHQYATLPQAHLLVNGAVVSDFTRPEVEVRVLPGDVLELESQYNFPLSFSIVDVSDNTKEPRPGETFAVSGGRIMIGKVVVR